jgi:hypothetical protein
MKAPPMPASRARAPYFADQLPALALSELTAHGVLSAEPNVQIDPPVHPQGS